MSLLQKSPLSVTKNALFTDHYNTCKKKKQIGWCYQVNITKYAIEINSILSNFNEMNENKLNKDYFIRLFTTDKGFFYTYGEVLDLLNLYN